jgi:hypothetical protein
MSKLRVRAHRFSTPKDFVVVGEEEAEVATAVAS